MTQVVAGLPFWDIRFDADGDADAQRRDLLLAEVPAQGITDLVVFTHGWNNDPGTARRLYDAFFGLFPNQLAGIPAGRNVRVGLAGVMWPSQRWSDEPIPDFTPAPAAILGGGGAAAASPAATAAPQAVSATIDGPTLEQLTVTFPAAADQLKQMATLLEGPPTDDAQAQFLACLKEFAQLAGTAGDDGEGASDTATGPRMLLDDHHTLFARYRQALQTSGAQLDGGSGGGQAGIGDLARGIWNGAKEALRGATYWEMKNRAGTVGRLGLGPLLARLHTAAPQLRVHLVGHSFGARLVSYALAGMPAGLAPSPVKSVTLLEGAFSHFAFTRPLPFDAGRAGALAGMQQRIDGPLTVVYSDHDSAVGTFYPLASLAAGDDTAGAHSPLYRWGGMGADGAQNQDARRDAIQPAGPGTTYRFSRDQILNVDASAVVRAGGPPSGAHSDIVHPEVSWIVLAAAGLV
jgi:hypothetical protein